MEIRWSGAVEVLERDTDRLQALADASVSAPFGDVEVLRSWYDSSSAATRVGTQAVAAIDRDSLCGLLIITEIPELPGHWRLWGHTVDFGVVWADPSRAGACWAHWFAAMQERGIASVVLRNMRVADPVVGALLAEAPRCGVELELLDRRVAPYVDLTTGHDGWLDARSPSQRKQFRRAERKFRAIPELELHVASGPTELSAAVDDFFTLHHKRRVALGRTSVYDNDGEATFLRTLIESWQPRGRVIALTARSAERLVGAELVLLDRHTWYSFNGGWSPDFAAHHPGTGMLLWAMEYARAEGARRYSLLEGEEPYKLRMADGAHQLATWQLRLS